MMTTKNTFDETRCDDCAFPDSQCAFSYGPSDADIVIVGEAPGNREEALGIPFVGRSGKFLYTMLDEIGIDKRNIVTTNIMACRPPENKTPTQTQRSMCSSRLYSTLQDVQPDYILTTGATAMKEVLNTDRGIMNTRGRIYWSNQFDCYVIPTLHPAQCLRVPSTARDFEADLQSLKRCLNGWNPPKIHLDQTDIPKELQTSYTVIQDLNQAQEGLEWCRNTFDLLSLDLETTGFNRRTSHILCMGIGYREGHALILGDSLWDQDDFLTYLTEWMNKSGHDPRDTMVGNNMNLLWQNGKFDIQFLRHGYGIQTARVDRDSMLEHYLLDERKGESDDQGMEVGRGVHDLQYLSGYYLNAPEYEDGFKQHVPDDGHYGDAPREKLYQYCAQDVDFAYQIHKNYLEPELDKSLKNVHTQTLIPGANMLADIEDRGMLVDQKRLETTQTEHESTLSDLKETMQEIACEGGWSTERYVEESDAKSKPDELNPASPKQMMWLLIDLFGLPKYHDKRTSNKKALSYWYNDVTQNEDSIRRTFIETLLEYREVHKLYSQYLKGMWKHIDPIDGRTHSNYNLHGTSTGRLSSSHPNLQNISRQDDIRNLFVPPDGWDLMEVDLSQAELRGLAVLSQDEFLLNVYQEGGDLHDEMTKRLFQDDFTYEQRQIAKRVDFGIVYDQTAFTLAEDLDIPIHEAEDHIHTFFEQAPQAKQWLDQFEQKPFQGETPSTPFGRKMRFTLLTDQNRESVRRTVRNFPIQSTSSDLHLLSGVEVWRKIRDRTNVYLINLVHDSMLLECKQDVTKEIAPMVKTTMEETSQNALDADIPFVADVEVSSHGWGSMVEKEEDESWDEFLKRARSGI